MSWYWDLFIVLGRDPNSCHKFVASIILKLDWVLEAAFITDSLEPQTWFEKLDEKGLGTSQFDVEDWTLQTKEPTLSTVEAREGGAGHERCSSS